MATKILVADDHEMVRAGLCSILQRQEGVEIVGEATSGREAVEMARRLAPDVAILDITMPGLNGLEAARQILEHSSNVRVIILSMHCDSMMVTEALKIGAKGYLLKSSASVELMLAVKAVRDGTTYLSPRASEVLVTNYFGERTDGGASSAFAALTGKQREVLQLLAEGKTNKEIAAAMSVSPKTVEAHRSQIMVKLNIRSIAGLTKYAIREGLTSAEP